MTPPAMDPVRIVPYADIAGDPRAVSALDDIFYVSSNTQSFSDDHARAAFRQRWLGRFLSEYPHCCRVAVATTGRPVGYICGSLQDPARDPLFADQPHFAAFADVTPAYPAQLHINVAPEARGHATGHLLIEAFVELAREAGAPGVHAISTRGARNLAFYAANHFAEIATVPLNGRDLVFLGRRCQAST